VVWLVALACLLMCLQVVADTVSPDDQALNTVFWSASLLVEVEGVCSAVGLTESLCQICTPHAVQHEPKLHRSSTVLRHF
jgi:hypothetical protein